MTNPIPHNPYGTLPLFTRNIDQDGTLSIRLRASTVLSSEPLGDGLIMECSPEVKGVVAVSVKNFAPFPRPSILESFPGHSNIEASATFYNEYGMPPVFCITAHSSDKLSIQLRVSTSAFDKLYFKGGLVIEYYPTENEEVVVNICIPRGVTNGAW